MTNANYLRKGGVTVKGMILAMCALLLAFSALAPQALAQSAPTPVVSEDPLPFAKNITVFPKRDMVTVDEASYFANKNINVKVIRNGVVIGKASGTADATGFFEINHPGGVCWEGTTPNIIAGDIVEVTDADSEEPDGARVPVRNVAVTQAATEDPNNSRVLTMKGTTQDAAGAPLPADEVEARIVQPDLLPLIGKRDIRAPGDNGRTGTTYNGTFTYDDGDANPNTFTATYTFTGPNAAAAVDSAVAGQSRVLAWKTDPATTERTGITIYEEDEIDGPGFGGCPQGANYAVTDAGRDAINTLNVDQPMTLGGVSHDASNVSVKLDDQNNPSTNPVVVENIVPTPASGAQTWSATLSAEQQDQVKAFPDGTLTAEGTFTIPNPNFDPDATDPNAPPPTVTIGGQTLNIEKDLLVPDAPTATPGAGTYNASQSVRLEAAEGDIRYTTGGAEPTSRSPKFVNQISVTASQTIRAKVFDVAGNPSTPAGQSTNFEYVILKAPVAPAIGNASAGNASATVRWTPPANNGGSAITEYMVNVVNATTNGSVMTVTDIPANSTSTVVSGLSNGTSYKFKVRAVTESGQLSPYSVFSNAVTPAAAVRAPGAPTIGTAAAGLTTDTAISARARWTPPANNGGRAISGYRVKIIRLAATGTALHATQPANPFRVTAASARQLNVTTGLVNGGRYRFQVQATNTPAGQPKVWSALSARSNIVTAR